VSSTGFNHISVGNYFERLFHSKRSKLLKQQAQLEKEKTVEISSNLDKFNSTRLALEKQFALLSTRQAALSER
jgi:hypothetical protein